MHLHPPHHKNTEPAAWKSIQKLRSERRLSPELCVNSKTHINISKSFTTKTTTLLSPLSAENLLPTKTSLRSTPFTSGRADSSSMLLARLLGWSREQLLRLTLIDPVCRKSCSSTCSKLGNYHFKEVPRKGYPFEQNASIHTSKEKLAWIWALRMHCHEQSLEESAENENLFKVDGN